MDIEDVRALARQLSVPVKEILENPEFLKELELDSIDLMELRMEAEEEG